MKITGVRVRRMRVELEPPFCAAWDPEPRRSFGATLVSIETDEGIVGHGSGDTMDGFEAFTHLFVGEDPRRIVRHVRVLESIDFHAGRYWPFEAALWDIMGQACGQPVSMLFGGATDRIRAYASCGEIMAPEARAESALRLREEGFRALKIRIAGDRLTLGIDTVRAVRRAVGDSMEIMVDLNQGWRMAGDIRPPLDNPAVNSIARELRDLGVFWLEEPLAGKDLRGLALLRAATGVRIAGGEMARTVDDLLAAIEADAFDVYQPDVVLAGGLSRVRMIAELALLRHRWFTPHSWTNGLGVLANLHVVTGVGGGPFFEFPYDPPGWTPERRDFFLGEPITVDREGYVTVPPRPGLGAIVDEDAVARYLIA
jgi:L-alanine-DL-glutamate epimerase-like enolase superfamily enzyme